MRWQNDKEHNNVLKKYIYINFLHDEYNNFNNLMIDSLARVHVSQDKTVFLDTSNFSCHLEDNRVLHPSRTGVKFEPICFGIQRFWIYIYFFSLYFLKIISVYKEK
jgi:hypothetical protein